MNRYEILLGKSVPITSIISGNDIINKEFSTKMLAWLINFNWLFSRWRWYRRWYGGIWQLWCLSLPINDIWFSGKSRPGCGLKILAREQYE